MKNNHNQSLPCGQLADDNVQDCTSGYALSSCTVNVHALMAAPIGLTMCRASPAWEGLFCHTGLTFRVHCSLDQVCLWWSLSCRAKYSSFWIKLNSIWGQFCCKDSVGEQKLHFDGNGVPFSFQEQFDIKTTFFVTSAIVIYWNDCIWLNSHHCLQADRVHGQQIVSDGWVFQPGTKS